MATVPVLGSASAFELIDLLLGVDPLMAAGAVLVAGGLVVLRRTSAGWQTRRDATDATRERTCAPAIRRAAADEDSPERPGCGRASTPGSNAPLAPICARGDGAAGSGGASRSTLAATLDRSRRLMAAEERVARELAGLPAGCWIVERYALVGDRRVPFLVLGTGGVFVLGATDGAWTMQDLDGLSRAADLVGGQLPEYDGPVRAAVCLAFDEVAPRRWHGGMVLQGRGGWVLGIDWLLAWLYGQDPGQGVHTEALRCLHAAAGPWWDRRVSARLPARQNVG